MDIPESDPGLEDLNFLGEVDEKLPAIDHESIAMADAEQEGSHDPPEFQA